MTKFAEMSVPEYLALVDFDCGASDWVLVGQDRIDKFAEAAGEAGGTIAPGVLILGILAGSFQRLMPAVAGAEGSVDFGFDRVRFLNPVPAGSRVRSHCIIRGVTERSPGVLQTRIQARVDIEHQEKPALIAEWIVLTRVKP